jgi:hypothetical protein
VAVFDPPEILDFGAIEGLHNVWTFTGQVDPSLAGEVVTLTGLPAVEGQTIVVQEDGTFTWSVTLGDDEQGIVFATIEDEIGQTSEQYGVIVTHTR